jgi:hypothetical protein
MSGDELRSKIAEVLSQHYSRGAGCACGPIASLHPVFVTEYDWADHAASRVVDAVVEILGPPF